MLLASKARGLARRENLAGWLHQTTRYCSANARRIHRRQLQRIQDAMGARMRAAATQSNDSEILGLLDMALAKLPAGLREAVLLRYMEGLSLDEAAARLAISGDAVAKRCERGLARLREIFASKGIAAGAVVGVMQGQVGTISEAQAMILTQAGMGTGTSVALGIASATGSAMLMGKVLVAAAIVLLAAGAGTAVMMVLPTSAPASQAASTTTPAAPAAEPSLQELQQGAFELGQRFVVALRDANEQALFELIDAPTDQLRRELAAGFVIEFRLGLYGRYPQRLDIAGLSRPGLGTDRNGRWTTAFMQVSGPILADARSLVIILNRVGDDWRVKQAVMSDRAGPTMRFEPPALEPAQPIHQPVFARALQAWERLVAHAQVIERLKQDMTDMAKDPETRAALEASRRELIDLAEAMRGTDLALSDSTLTRLSALFDRMIAALSEPDPKAVFQAIDRGDSDSPELAADAERLGRLGETLAGRLDAIDAAASIGSRPPSFAPAVRLTLGWDGTVFELPGPVTAPPWIGQTQRFRLWQKQRQSAILPARDDEGNVYAITYQGNRDAAGAMIDKVRLVQMFRPDATLAASAEYDDTKPFPTRWATYDKSGRRYETRVHADGHGNISQVEFFDPDGQRRIWNVHQSRVRLESTTDPIGEERKTVWMVKKE